MCDWFGGDDDSDDRMGGLQIVSAQKLDPSSEARQKYLWNQAQEFAGSDPFTGIYGGAAAMPGMSAMSQRGQQYLTNQILGPGAYEAQNLGFTGYQRPAAAQASADQGYPGYQALHLSEAEWAARMTDPEARKAKDRDEFGRPTGWAPSYIPPRPGRRGRSGIRERAEWDRVYGPQGTFYDRPAAGLQAAPGPAYAQAAPGPAYARAPAGFLGGGYGGRNQPITLNVPLPGVGGGLPRCLMWRRRASPDPALSGQ
jgi:hypothetical protein